MEKVEITQQSPKSKIELSDSDFALYQTLQELITAINDLTRRLSLLRGFR